MPIFAVSLVLAAVAPASGQRLTARPQPLLTSSHPIGLFDLGEDATAYVPAGLSGPAPLLVLLHGAGHRGDMIAAYHDEADRRGLVLLAPHSEGPTWDLVASASAAPSMATRLAAPSFGRDPARISRALAALFAQVAVDPGRVVLIGFSDGASYALALGLANPALFTAIVAHSPGLVLFDGGARRQRCFISHGRRDDVLPFAVAYGPIADAARRACATLHFAAFDGRHEFPDVIRSRALDKMLAGDPIRPPRSTIPAAGRK